MSTESYNKNDVALEPPMGWNSYDYFNTMVNESQIRSNAEYMSKNLKKHGWEYIVVDIQWSEPNAGAKNKENISYIPFSRFCTDEFSRQIPAENRFPSSANGKGFKPLADYIHSLNLKFGIHIMRGLPRHCAHEHKLIKTHDGQKVTADEIADVYSICKWNPDMYGIDYTKKYAQDYYDSIFELYAEWGVDFVKVDDICRHVNEKNYEQEVIMMAEAIKKSGRKMVLSLSPGPALIEKAFLYEQYANMWRITDDFWDKWELLKAMFERCEVWQKHTGEGNWPDCDMLPINVLSYGWEDPSTGKKGRKSAFTKEETKTMISLWCIFRSPLILGTDLPQLDEESLNLITNDEIIAMNKNKNQAKLVKSGDDLIEWTSKCEDGKSYYVYFNVSEKDQTVKVKGNNGIRDLWEKKDLGNEVELCIKPDDVKALKL